MRCFSFLVRATDVANAVLAGNTGPGDRCASLILTTTVAVVAVAVAVAFGHHVNDGGGNC